LAALELAGRIAAMRSRIIPATAERCPRCFLPLRWCVCPAFRTVESPLQVDVLMHHREMFRPSSTGHLIQRVVAGARTHLWRRERQIGAKDLLLPGRELWVLHPSGERMPRDADPAAVQAVILDGSWREASTMGQHVAGWGRQIRLPMSGQSRYWLRAQQDGGRFSSVEALLFLFEALGLHEAHTQLRLQFELHVYASLRARGSKPAALEFLKTSPIATAWPELIAQMDVRRPR